ncbi:MAG: hypothetical protein Q8942_14235 [Bacillota bacterium]|nr:hypothetical protein [Bacillota bacterium]
MFGTMAAPIVIVLCFLGLIILWKLIGLRIIPNNKPRYINAYI